MSNIFADIFFWLEISIAFLLLICVFFALVYFSFGFVEERFRFILRFGQILNLILLLLCILIPFTNYGIFPFLSTLAENLCWFVLFSRDIQYIKLLSFDLIGGFVFTLIAHISWIFGFMESETNGYVALSCYLLMVWSLPLLIVITFPLIFDESGNSKVTDSYAKPKSLWPSLFSKIIPKLQALIPRSSSSKLD
ncbi:hypothetical protein M9Y10_008317 [Tritrichomonas musculus]|uniref:Transmembrane adaptor Erv26 n=1 Tax=Tritrichomonas musculus TaxID=1915356 RepID=A0ABR2IYT9_9EUKA